MRKEAEGRISTRLKDRRQTAQSVKMCWLPIDQPLLRPGDSSCSARRPSACTMAQLLASRLRRIGDQLEKSWTAEDSDVGFSCGDAGALVVTARGQLRGFLYIAVHFTVLVLFGTRRHL